MKKSIYITFLLLSINCFGQTSKLIIYPSVYSNVDEYESPFLILVLHNNDTILNKTIYEENVSNYYDPISLDSIEKGEYIIFLKNLKEGNDKIVHTKKITIDQNQTATVDMNINEYLVLTQYNEKSTDSSNMSDIELKLSYGQDNWINNDVNLKSNISFGINASAMKALNKHVGILGGYGFELSQYNLKIGNNSIESKTLAKLNERYNYFNTNVNLKFRFTSGNQLISNSKNFKYKLDIGAAYYFPLYFRNIIKFENDIKMIKNNIHNFSDARVFVNFGYNQILLYMEYRIFNFVKSDYFQVPKINAGIKISINPETY